MRDLTKVIDEMMAIIPSSEVSLINGLDSRKQSVLYTPPETMGLRWGEVAGLLEDRFCKIVKGEPQEPVFKSGSWQEQVFNIWMDK